MHTANISGLSLAQLKQELQQAKRMLKAVDPVARKVETRLRLEGSLTEFFKEAWPPFDPAPYTHG